MMNNNNHSAWSEANHRYLSALIRLLKAQLEQYAAKANGENERSLQANVSVAPEDLSLLTAGMSKPPAIEQLAAALGLSSFEKNMLLLCAGIELDAGLSELVAAIQGSPSLFQPTFGLGLSFFSDAHWSAITPAGPLRYWQLLELTKTQLITRSPLRIDEHVLHFLTGIDNHNERIKEVAEPFYYNEELVPSQLILAERVLQTISQKTDNEILPVIQLYGIDRNDNMTIAAYISERLSCTAFTLPAYSLPVFNREVTELARIWNREAALKNYLLFLDCTNLDTNDKSRVQSLISFIDNIRGVVILNGDQWSPVLRRSKISFDTEKPTSAEQFSLWESIIGEGYDTSGMGLAKIVSQFNLSAATIRKAGFEAFTSVSPNGKKNGELAAEMQNKLWKACCRYTRPNVDELAQRIEPVAAWGDIVLPDLQRNVLGEIAAQVKLRKKVYDEWGFATKGSRGLGISALFAGESGTGKTMASEVLANDLGLDLYKIDLSKVVNKYIGETEKNLKKIFDAAEDGGAILLFDEADALFGKRSDVKDSHDRYSNIEVSYLLQRMEAYRGLAILTTNMKNALDKAFLRRIRFVVQFPFPDAYQRAEIWKKVFPAGTPKKELDMDKLGKLSLPGGGIRNIAMNAAFFAAAEDGPVQMSHIFRAARSEYDKMEKPFNNMEIKSWQ